MIKINLLIKPPPPVRWRVVATTAAGAILTGIIVIVALGSVSGLQGLRSDLDGAKQLLEEYRRAADRLPAVQQQWDSAQGRRKALGEIERNQRFSQSAVLKAVLVMPPGVSVTDIAFEGPDLVITGRSASFDGAMSYLRYLRSSPLLITVTEQSSKSMDTGVTVFTFSARIREEVKQP